MLDPQKKLRIAASFSVLCKSLIKIDTFFFFQLVGFVGKAVWTGSNFLWEGILVTAHFLSNNFLLAPVWHIVFL